MTDPGLLRTAAAAALLALGCLAMLLSSVGMLRFPDFYSRIHPAGKADTLGLALILAGLMIWEGLTLVSLKLLIILIFTLIAAPTATHALAKAAFLDGLLPWKKEKGRDGA